MCKQFKCTPTQLRKEDQVEIELYAMVYNEIMKKNPMFMFA